jgi:hypothetical protein
MIDSAWQWVVDQKAMPAALAMASVLMLVASALVLPWLLARLPEDYFVDPARHTSRLHRQHPAVYLAIRIAKNLLGWILVLAGIAMLVLPGQGLLTILMGMILSDFPGKFTLERYIACRAGVLKGINWLRRRAGRGPLLTPKRPDGSDCTAAQTAKEPRGG